MSTYHAMTDFYECDICGAGWSAANGAPTYCPVCPIFERPEVDSKPSNPKDLIGSDKTPMGLVPSTAIALMSLAHLEGALKYGASNWREAGVRASIYIDAQARHMAKFLNGEWADPVTLVPHLASANACNNIIMDALACGKLIDDRPKPAPVSELIDSLGSNVRHLRDLFADKDPIHYTISGPVQKGEG